MKPIFTLAKKEFSSAFQSPIAYVFLCTFLFLSFWIFFSGVYVTHQATLRPFFNWFPILFIVLLPAMTMGQWSEEYKSGTYEILSTLPISEAQMILGKFLSCKWFLLVLCLATLPLPLFLSLYGDLDNGQILASYLATMLLGSAYLSFGFLISSLSQNQIIAYILTAIGLFIFHLLGEPLVNQFAPDVLIPVLEQLSFSRHFESLTRGVLDSRSVLFFISSVAVFLTGNWLVLKTKKS